MELILHWYWILKLTLTAIFIFLLYKAIYQYDFNNRTYNILALIFFILMLVNPIKLKPDSASIRQNKQIEATKQLPAKVEDNSFKQNTNAIKGISKEELK